MSLRVANHALTPPVVDHGLGRLGARPVVAIERTRSDVAIELRAIGRKRGLESVKDFLRKSVRIGWRLHHQRRHRAENGSLRHPALAMPPQVTHNLAAAGGMADMDRLLYIEMRCHGP